MTVFRAATLRTFFFAIHVGAKELSNIFVKIRYYHYQASTSLPYF